MPVSIMSSADGSSTPFSFYPEMENVAKKNIRKNIQLDRATVLKMPLDLIVDVKKNWTKLPDCFGNSSGPYVFSPKLRALIATLEPASLHYHEVTVKTKKQFLGSITHAGYGIITHVPTIDCIDIDATQFLNGFGSLGKAASFSEILGNVYIFSEKHLYLKKMHLVGAHVWKLPREYNCSIVFSDELWGLCKSKKITGLDVEHRFSLT